METHQNGLGDGIVPARDTVPAVPNLGLPPPADDENPAITDMDHAKQLLRDLRKQNRNYERTIDAMANKMDALTSMMNTLMENQAQQKQVPNITGWPLAQELVHSNPPPTSVVNSLPTSRAMVPPPNLQTLVLELPGQSFLQAANWGAVHSPRLPATSPGVPDVPIATLAALLPREDEVNLDNMESKTLDSCSASRTESSFLDQCPERGNYLEEGLPQQLSFNSCSEEEDDFNYDYELNRERPEAHCKSLTVFPKHE